MKEMENCSGHSYVYFQRMKRKSRKKDRARPLQRRGQLGVSEPSDLYACGRKGGEQPILPDSGKTDHVSEIADVVSEEMDKRIMIARMHRRRINGTLECRHDIAYKWTSLRTHDDEHPEIPVGQVRCMHCGWQYSM